MTNSIHRVSPMLMHASLFPLCKFVLCADLGPEPAIVTTQHESLSCPGVVTCHQQQSQDHHLGDDFCYFINLQPARYFNAALSVSMQ